MMKLLSLAAIVGTAAAVKERPANGRHPNGRAAEDDKLRQKKSLPNGDGDSGKKRLLRSSSQRNGRADKGGKNSNNGQQQQQQHHQHNGHGTNANSNNGSRSKHHYNNNNNNDSPDWRPMGSGMYSPDHGHGYDDDNDDHHHGHGYDDDDHHHDHYDDDGDDRYGHNRSGKGGKYSGKSGKASGNWGDDGGGKWSGSESWSDDGWGHEEVFYLLPSACPNECITSMVTNPGNEFKDAIKQCKANDESHMWLVRSDGSYIQIESYYDHGMCIAVDYQRGDADAMLAKTCYNGELVLKECDSDYGTEWYFTGGQLINSMCWGAGLSSSMTVFFDDDSKDKDVVKECQKDVAVWGANDEAVLKADTFMFVNRLPEAPFVIQDLEDAIKEKEPKTKNSDDNKKMGAIYMNEVDDSIDVEGST